MSYASDAINVQVEGGKYPTNTQRATAGFKAPGQTPQWWANMQLLTGAVTSIALYTVPAGRTFYLTDINISTDIASGSNTDVQLLNGTTASLVARGSMHSLAPFEMVNLETQPTATGGSVLSLVIGSAATTAHIWYDIGGWDEANTVNES